MEELESKLQSCQINSKGKCSPDNLFNLAKYGNLQKIKELINSYTDLEDIIITLYTAYKYGQIDICIYLCNKFNLKMPTKIKNIKKGDLDLIEILRHTK